MDKERLALNTKGITLFLLVSLVCVFADQLTKHVARLCLDQSSHISFIPHVLSFTLVKNPGAAFGLGQGMTWLFVAFALVLCLGALWYVATHPDLKKGLIFVLALIAGGGIGNGIDRVIAGVVTDFIKTDFIRFPVFNLADIFVCVGIFFLMLAIFRMEEGE